MELAGEERCRARSMQPLHAGERRHALLPPPWRGRRSKSARHSTAASTAQAPASRGQGSGITHTRPSSAGTATPATRSSRCHVPADKNRPLFEAWTSEDPVDAGECERDRRSLAGSQTALPPTMRIFSGEASAPNERAKCSWPSRNDPCMRCTGSGFRLALQPCRENSRQHRRGKKAVIFGSVPQLP
jgi:hypothetical protein